MDPLARRRVGRQDGPPEPALLSALDGRVCPEEHARAEAATIVELLAWAEDLVASRGPPPPGTA